jgi:MFS family permease
VACAAIQAAVFLPLMAAALTGTMPVGVVFLLAALYFGSGLAAGPAWNAWVGALVPRVLWARYFSRRTRVSQLGLLVGFALGGFVLEAASRQGLLAVTVPFALLFLIAAGSRMTSARLLASHHEPRPPGRESDLPGLRSMVRSLRVDADRKVLVYLLVAQAAVYVSGPYFNPYMLGQLRLDYLGYMVLACAAMAAKVVFLPALGRLAERWGASRLLWAGGVATAPVPLLWLVSDRLPYLFALQVYSGMVWAAFELATLLLFFETIPTEKRMGVLTIFNLANAAAIASGSFLGAGILAALGTNRQAYLVLFVVSALARGGALLLLVHLPRTALAPRLAPTPSRAVWARRVSEGLGQLALRCDEAQPIKGPLSLRERVGVRESLGSSD